MSWHILEILSLQTLRFCRLGQAPKRNWLNANTMILQRNVYTEKKLSKFLVYNVQLVQKNCYPCYIKVYDVQLVQKYQSMILVVLLLMLYFVSIGSSIY